MYHRKPRLAPEQGAAEDHQFPAARDIENLQIIGEDPVSADVDDHRVCCCRNADKADGQSVQTVGQVDRVGRSHDNDYDKGDIKPAEVDEELLHERNGQNACCKDRPGDTETRRS